VIHAVALAALLAPLAAVAAGAEEAAVTIPTRAGVTETFLYEAPADPGASVVLLPGGAGAIGIHEEKGKPALDKDKNFLVRTRGLFVLQGMATATLDAPSDHSSGMRGAFRIGPENAQDIGAVVAWLKQKSAAPVWLVGTSMGTVSGANAAVRLGNAIDGLVLTSSIIVAGGDPEGSGIGSGVLSLDIGEIAVPVMMLANAEDACFASPPSGAQRILMQLRNSPRTAVRILEGGATPRSGVCEAMSRHGYIGIEDQAVAAIAAFVLAKQ